MTESQLRRLAKKHGFKFSKTNWRRDSIDNVGGFMIVDTHTNTVVDGARYDLSLADVEFRLLALTA